MNGRRAVPVFLVIVLVLSAGGYYVLSESAGDNGFSASGTIEATESHVGSLLGGRVDAVNVEEGDKVQVGQVLVEVHPGASSRTSTGREMVRAPIDGLVLDRLVEPGEIAAPGTPLVTLIDPADLTLTVYVAEDRYGQIALGQTYPVKVDSFPDQTFQGTVTHIANQAEFTPRNVQTTDSRKNTVFAIRLDLPPSDGKLKPGMPADVYFQNGP